MAVEVYIIGGSGHHFEGDGVDSRKSKVDVRVHTEGDVFGQKRLTGPSSRPAFIVANDTLDRAFANITGWTLYLLVAAKLLGRSAVAVFGTAHVERTFCEFDVFGPEVSRVALGFGFAANDAYFVGADYLYL